jgi:ProP effector
VYADALAALGGAIPARDLKSALRAYTSRASYLHALTADAPRVGIDGEPAGAVTREEKAVAKARLAERAEVGALAEVPAEPPSAAHTAPKPPTQTSTAEAGEAPAPAAPKRLSLADLREAGRRRRL